MAISKHVGRYVYKNRLFLSMCAFWWVLDEGTQNIGKLPDWRHTSEKPVRPELVEGLSPRNALALTSSARTDAGERHLRQANN
jgi:hypothetical protein